MAGRNRGMSVYFELRALQEAAVQQSTACGARNGRRGQLAAFGQFARQFSVNRHASNSEQRIVNQSI